jgi:hypothetical protein
MRYRARILGSRPVRLASLLSGRKIDFSLRIAGLFADNTMQAKYLERQNNTWSAGSRQALLREAEGGSRESEGCHHPAGAV